jgi:2-dehydro-3-deoxygalactonokinase
MSNAPQPEWIAVDWGTTHLRTWAMQNGRPVAEAQSADGMATLKRDEFEHALLTLVEPWLGSGITPVLACGMVGARQGWVEAPYQTIPAKPLGERAISVPRDDPRIAAFVIPGLKQLAPADVMRGEETQIAGFISTRPDWDGVMCLPGTHTKWAHVSAGEVVSFQTFMTGEMFSLLGKRSVLRHSVASEGWDETAFSGAVEDAMAKPERLAARLFGLRASDLLEARPKAEARSKLSGYLIGAELAAARPYWLGQQVAIIGSADTGRLYRKALQAQGVPAAESDATEMTLAGLCAAFRTLKDPA